MPALSYTTRRLRARLTRGQAPSCAHVRLHLRMHVRMHAYACMYACMYAATAVAYGHVAVCFADSHYMNRSPTHNLCFTAWMLIASHPAVHLPLCIHRRSCQRLACSPAYMPTQPYNCLCECTDNQVNGGFSCENSQLLRDELRGGLGFEGFVVSDWGAARNGSFDAGLDVEMPAAEHINEASLAAGQVLHGGRADGVTMGANRERGNGQGGRQGGIGRDRARDRESSDGLKDEPRRARFRQRRIDEAVLGLLIPMMAVGVMDAPEGRWDPARAKLNVTHNSSKTCAAGENARARLAASLPLT